MSNSRLLNSLFIHVPKTGGGWVSRVLTMSGLGEVVDKGHPRLDEVRERPFWRPGLFCFAFVRHPLEWHRSEYRYHVCRPEKQNGPTAWKYRPGPHDVPCSPHGGVNFGEYCEYLLEQWPGYCSRLFRERVGPCGDQIEFVGRFENLRRDLLRALGLAGETITSRCREIILQTPPINASPKCSAEYTAKHAAAFRQVEAEAFERFGYQWPPS